MYKRNATDMESQMLTHKVSPKLILAALILVCIGLLTSCVRQRVSKGDVNQRISRDISIGANKSQVIAFLDSLEIKGFKASRSEYIFIADDKYPKAKGYIVATIGSVKGDHYNYVGMMFYFDESERLITYQVDDF